MEPKITIQKVTNGFTVEVDPHDEEPDVHVFDGVTNLIIWLVQYYKEEGDDT